MTDIDTCPACHSSMEGDPIPDRYRDYYGPETTRYSRIIGVEISELYDGILYWQCPDCGHRWHRWPEGHPWHTLADWAIRKASA